MARLIVGQTSANEHTSRNRRPGVVVGLRDVTRERLPPPLHSDVDHLAELRGLIRRAQECERQLTGEILEAMKGAGVDRVEGDQAVAIRETRTTLRPAIGLFPKALGPRSHGALTVNLTAGRRLMGADDLAAISETVVTPMLRIEAPIDGKPGA